MFLFRVALALIKSRNYEVLTDPESGGREGFGCRALW